MKKLTLLFSSIFLLLPLIAQNADSLKNKKEDAYRFTVVKENPISAIKNQASSSTCWSFSGLGFIESELLRMGKGEYDLSQMFIVRKNLEDKAKKYVRTHGALNFAPGGSFEDVIRAIDDYGLMPNEAYVGLNYGEKNHSHSEMDNVLKGYVSSMINENDQKKLTIGWFKGFGGILDAYLGVIPEKFTYKGKSYTSASFRDFLGIKASDYVSITSYNHHPFYSEFALEIPDNWRWALSYNLPVDEMMATIDNAVMNGYTVAWGSDVSEIGFSRNGIGIVPDLSASENAGSDQARWLGLSPREKDAAVRKMIGEVYLKEKPVESITQEVRQAAYDNFETTDDHGMLIYGIAKDQNGVKYYMVKNSWGEAGKYKGLWYVSEAFVKYKTMNIIINKNSIPKDIAKKIKL